MRVNGAGILLVLLLAGQAGTAGAEDNGAGQPFTFHDRFQTYIHRTYSWERMSLLSADAGLAQVTGEPKEWGRGPESFAYRYLSQFGKRVVTNSAQFGLEFALKQDSRYRISQESGIRRRVWYGFKHTLFAYTRDGSLQPAYGRLGAAMIGTAVAYSWYPCRPSAPDVFESLGWTILDDIGNNLLSEFESDLKRTGAKVWRRAFRH